MQKGLIVYYSMSGNTEMMANAIREGLAKDMEVTCVNVSEAPSIDGYDKIMFGCPATGVEELDETEFEPYFASIEKELKGKKIALFGSYNWGDGQFMRDWVERARKQEADLFEEGLLVNLTPDDEGIAACKAYGERFSAY